MALPQDQIDRLDDRVVLRHRLEQYHNNGYGKMCVSWSAKGIADTSLEVDHVVTITDKITNDVIVSTTLTKENAYNQFYRVYVDKWNMSHSYKAVLTIDDYEATLEIPAYKVTKPATGLTEHFVPPNLSVKQTSSGIRFGLEGCVAKLRTRVKNFRVKRCPIYQTTPVTKYVSAVEVPVPLPDSFLDFNAALFQGKYTTALTPFESQEIFNNKSEAAFKITLNDSGEEFIEITDEAIIESYPKSKVVKSYDPVDSSIHNQINLLYEEIQQDGTSKYFRYRKTTIFVPHQYVGGQVSYEMPHIPLNYIDPDQDGLAHVRIPGDFREADTTTMDIQVSYRDTNNNIFEFNSTPVTTLTFEDYLPTGVTLTDGFSYHTDTDVVEGTWYRYKIELDLWDNQTIVLMNEIIPYETSTQSSFIHLSTDELTEPSDNISLNEKDFQSGISPGSLPIIFSDDPADLKKYEIYLKTIEDCVCQA